MVKRFHLDLSGETLFLWSYIHICRALFQPKGEGVPHYLHKQLLALQSRNPQKITGRHLFLEALFDRAQLASDGKQLSQQAKVGPMAMHSSLFRSLPLPVQEQFHRDAAVKASRSASVLEGDRHNVEASLALHVARTRQEVEEQGYTNRTSQHWSNKQEFQALQRLLVDILDKLLRGHYRPIIPGPPSIPLQVAVDAFNNAEISRDDMPCKIDQKWLRPLLYNSVA